LPASRCTQTEVASPTSTRVAVSAARSSRREDAVPAVSVMTTSTLAPAPVLVMTTACPRMPVPNSRRATGVPATPSTGSLELLQAKSPGLSVSGRRGANAAATTGTSARTCRP
jgi:hypothetical protein